MLQNDPYQNPKFKEIYHRTDVVRKPISGIVSDYHVLPYVLISPDEKVPTRSIKVTGTINVSPKFVVTPGMLGESFSDVFDPETFDKEIEARLFSFVYAGKKNVKVESTGFAVENVEEGAKNHIERTLDRLLKQEDLRTGLIFGPQFCYYPISVDRFISEIIDREFRVC